MQHRSRLQVSDGLNESTSSIMSSLERLPPKLTAVTDTRVRARTLISKRLYSTVCSKAAKYVMVLIFYNYTDTPLLHSFKPVRLWKYGTRKEQKRTNTLITHHYLHYQEKFLTLHHNLTSILTLLTSHTLFTFPWKILPFSFLQYFNSRTRTHSHIYTCVCFVRACVCLYTHKTNFIATITEENSTKHLHWQLPCEMDKIRFQKIMYPKIKNFSI